MKVIKKLGFREPYDINKIKIALQKTAKEIDIKFTLSNWKELKPRIESRLEPIMKDKEEIYFWEIDEVVIDALLRSRFNELTKKYIKTRSDVIKDKLNDLGLSPHAMFIMKERYLRKDDSGEPLETVKELFCRIASAIADVEKNSLKEKYTELYSNMLLNRDFIPNSPAIVSAGTKHKGTLAACFAYGISDSLDNILDTVKKTAKTFQLGGGVGVSIAKLRERGSKIDTTNGYSSGSVEFLNLFDVMCNVIKTGGFRKGALMCLTEYNHPDIEWFIHCKKEVDKLNNMNISVLVNDKFFEAINQDKDIPLISPKNGEQVDSISANLLLEHIATNIWETGEPGLLFYDAMNKANPTPHLGDIRLTNPCVTGDAEIGIVNSEPIRIKDLVGKENIRVYCSDGHSICERTATNIRKTRDNVDVYRIVLSDNSTFKATKDHNIMLDSGKYKQVKDLITEDKLFGFRNTNIFIKIIEYAGKEDVYNMEVDDYHNYVIVTNHNGTGYTGLVVKNCSESNLLSNEACVLGSINLVNHMTEDRQDMDWDRLAETTKLATRFLDDMIDASPYPTKDVEKMVKSTRKIGVGIMGFADILIHMGIRYSSKQAITMAKKIMSFINDVADQESKSLGGEKGLYKEYKKGYRKRRNAVTTVIAPTGSISLIAGVSPGIEPNFYKEYTRIIDNEIIKVTHPLGDREVFESSHEISPEQHLRILAEFQKYTENSVSKTILAPENTSVEDVKSLLLKAHKLGVKGVTIFRDNCSREPLIKCEDCKI